MRFLVPFTVLVVIGMLVAASYPGYRTAMGDIRIEVLADSHIIETAAGPVEFAEVGTGAPVLVVHGNGGGYDQGLLAGRMFIGEGFRLIAPSRFGYLHTPLPEDGSAARKPTRTPPCWTPSTSTRSWSLRSPTAALRRCSSPSAIRTASQG